MLSSKMMGYIMSSSNSSKTNIEELINTKDFDEKIKADFQSIKNKTGFWLNFKKVFFKA